MLKIKRLFRKKSKTKLCSFKYEILWENGNSTTGKITNSEVEPHEIFLTDKMTYLGNKIASYYSRDKI